MRIGPAVAVLGLAFTGWLFPGCTSTAATGYVIEGNIEGAGDGEAVLYRSARYLGYTYDEVDRVPMNGGRFRFAGRVDLPEMFWVEVAGKKIPIFLGNDRVTLSANAEAPEDAVISGSPLHDRLIRLRAEIAPIDEEIDGIYEEQEAAEERGETARVMELEQAAEMAEARRRESTLAFVVRNGDSPLAPFIALRHLSNEMDLDELEPLVAALDPSLASMRYVQQLRERVEVLSRVAIGATSPDFTLPTSDGGEIALSSLRGKYVLIDFWASWCSPCRKQNPELIRLRDEYGPRGFEIIGVGIEFNRDGWLQAVEDDGLPWINVSDVTGFDNVAAQSFAVRSIPFNALLDPQGVIVAKALDEGELRVALSSLLD